MNQYALISASVVVVAFFDLIFCDVVIS